MIILTQNEHRLIQLLLLVALASPHGQLLANIERADLGSDFFVGWQVVSNEVLGQSRGGFKVDDGFNISFGIKSMVVIDGELISQNQLVIPSLSSTAGLVGLQDLSKPMANVVNAIKAGYGEALVPDSDMSLNELLPDNLANNFSASGKSGTIINGIDLQEILTRPVIVQSSGGGAIGGLGDANPLGTIIQNQRDNAIIQTYNIMNIELENIGTLRSHNLNDMLIPLL